MASGGLRIISGYEFLSRVASAKTVLIEASQLLHHFFREYKRAVYERVGSRLDAAANTRYLWARPRG